MYRSFTDDFLGNSPKDVSRLSGRHYTLAIVSCCSSNVTKLSTQIFPVTKFFGAFSMMFKVNVFFFIVCESLGLDWIGTVENLGKIPGVWIYKLFMIPYAMKYNRFLYVLDLLNTRDFPRDQMHRAIAGSKWTLRPWVCHCFCGQPSCLPILLQL